MVTAQPEQVEISESQFRRVCWECFKTVLFMAAFLARTGRSRMISAGISCNRSPNSRTILISDGAMQGSQSFFYEHGHAMRRSYAPCSPVGASGTALGEIGSLTTGTATNPTGPGVNDCTVMGSTMFLK